MSQTISCLTECLSRNASRPRATPYDHQAEHGSDADGRKSEKGEHTIGSGRLVDDACDKGEQRLRSIHGGAHDSYGVAGVLPPIDRKSVVEGKSVSVRVDHGVPSVITK